MAENIQIEVKFDPKNKESTFGLPDRVRVEKGSTIEWVIKDSIVMEDVLFRPRSFRQGVIFTLYFEKTTPFQWKTESLRIMDKFPSFYDKKFPIRIAKGKAENIGDHKYGLKLFSLKNEDKDKPDFDDDPLLIVY